MFSHQISRAGRVNPTRLMALISDLTAAVTGVSSILLDGLYVTVVYSSSAFDAPLVDFINTALSDHDNVTLTLRDVWEIEAGAIGTHTLSADKTSIAADGVDAATVTVAPASGEYAWSLWLDGERVASSATLGTIDAADGYALAITADDAGAYILRVIQAGTYKEITITAVE